MRDLIRDILLTIVDHLTPPSPSAPAIIAEGQPDVDLDGYWWPEIMFPNQYPDPDRSDELEAYFAQA